jgi:hypothetical protein
VPANDPSCPGTPEKPDIPHCFNQTNLHSHGLWVSPAGNSDNVLVNVAPGVSFQYEYNVPLEFKFICAPIEGACDDRYLLVRSSNYIFLRSINFDLAKRSCTNERRSRTAGANEVAGLRQWAGWYQATL